MNASNAIGDQRHNNNLPSHDDDDDDDDSTTTSQFPTMEMMDDGKAQDIFQARELVKQLEKKHLERTEKASLMVDAKRTWENMSNAKRWNPRTIHFMLDVCDPKTNPLPSDLSWEGHRRGMPWSIQSNRDLLLKRLAVVPHFEETYYDKLFEPPHKLKNDKEVMLAICSRNSQALQFCSKKLQNDRDVVLAAVLHRFHFAPTAIQYASTKLRNEKIMARSVLSQEYGIRAFSHLSERLQQDAKLAILAIKKAGPEYAASNEHFLDLPYEFRDDEEVVWEAVKQRGSNLRFVTDPDLVLDYDLAMEACRQDGTSLAFAHESVQRQILANPNDLMIVLSNGGGAWIEEAPNDAHWEPAYMMAAIANKYDGDVFDLADLYKSDPVFFYELLAASNNIYEVYKVLPEELQGKKEVIQAIFDTNDHVNEALVWLFFDHYDLFAEDQTFLLQVMRKGFVDVFFRPSAKSILEDKSFMIQACKIYGFSLALASVRLQMDEDCLRSAFESEEPIVFSTIANNFPAELWTRSNLVALIIRYANKDECMADDERSALGKKIAEKVPAVLWSQARTVCLAFAKRGFPQEFIPMDARRIYSNDAEIWLEILRSKPMIDSRRRWYNWGYSGGPGYTLLTSFSFMELAVVVHPQILGHAGNEILRNEKLMLSAIGNSVSLFPLSAMLRNTQRVQLLVDAFTPETNSCPILRTIYYSR